MPAFRTPHPRERPRGRGSAGQAQLLLILGALLRAVCAFELNLEQRS